VLHSCKEHERLRALADTQSSGDVDKRSNYILSDDSGSEGESDNSDSDDSDFDLQRVVNMYEDARRLHPWQGEQRHLLKRVRDGIESSWDEKAQLDALLKFYKSLIFQHIRSDTF
jgi:hypothetical protein